MTMRAAVAIISKVPRRGKSKTRLARTLGEPAALALHVAFLQDELAELDAPNEWALHLLHDPPEGDDDRAMLDALLAGDTSRAPGAATDIASDAATGDAGHVATGVASGAASRVATGAATGVALSGGALARDLLGGFAALLTDHDRAVIVSGDVPHLPADTVRRALRALDDADVVLGPGPDGGYYLIGMRAPHDVFTPITMSTSSVVNATIALARSKGLQVATVERLTDIDEAQDLLALEHVPAALAPRTRAAVARLERGEHAAQLPAELQVEVTSRCNLPCSACIRTHEDVAPDKDLTLDEFIAMTAELPRLERVAFQLNGESLLNPDLFGMIEHAAHRGASTVLNSNGTLLEAHADRLLETPLDELRVSLDGHRPATVLRMAGADIFERVTAGVSAFITKRGERARPKVSLWMVLSRWTLDELPGLVRLAAELGVEEVYTQRLVLTGHGVAMKENSLFGRVDDDVRARVAEAERLAASVGVTLRASGRRPVIESLTPPTEDNPYLACWRPWRSAVITASKWIIPCCISSFRASYEAQKLGDLGRQSWSDLWNDAPYRAVRRGLLDKEPKEFCAGCTKEWSL